MGRKKRKTNDETYWTRIVIVVAIILLFIYYFFSKTRSDKEKELAELKRKLQENEQLDTELQKRKRRYFDFIRWSIVCIYLVINLLYFYFRNVSIDFLVDINSASFIFVSALTFARFGSFDGYHRWWFNWEIRIEAWIYRKSPQLKKIIEDQKIYKTQLEKEINDIDSIFKNSEEKDGI